MDEAQIKGERESVVGSALGWLGTPYHHMGEVRGVGADCVTFLRCAFIDARIGLIPEPLAHYPQDWHLHRDAEKYMEGLTKYCTEQAPLSERPAEPADILLFQFGRVFSHGALVVSYPNLLHAKNREGVVRVDYSIDQHLRSIGKDGTDNDRPVKVFTLTRWVT